MDPLALNSICIEKWKSIKNNDIVSLAGISDIDFNLHKYWSCVSGEEQNNHNHYPRAVDTILSNEKMREQSCVYTLFPSVKKEQYCKSLTCSRCYSKNLALERQNEAGKFLCKINMVNPRNIVKHLVQENIGLTKVYPDIKHYVNELNIDLENISKRWGKKDV